MSFMNHEVGESRTNTLPRGHSGPMIAAPSAMRIRRGWHLVAVVAASCAAAGPAAGADAARDAARVSLDEQSVVARLVATCTRRQARSRRGCAPHRWPTTSELGERLRLRPGGVLRIRLPVRARRLILNVGEFGDDYALVIGVAARRAGAGRRRWTAELPARFPPRTNRVALTAITRNGGERTYHAAAIAEEN